MSPLICQKDLFGLPAEVHYINCAYMGPLPRRSVAAGQTALAQKMNPTGYKVDDFFEPVYQLKSTFSSLIGNDDPDRIAIIPSVSYGIANVSHNLELRANENVIILQDQFPSNVYPWQRLCAKTGAQLRIIPRKTSASLWNEAILDAIDQGTRVVALPHVHWADGTRFDLAEIRSRTTEVGALLIIDGTQSIGAMPFDWKAFSPDALICAGYKWLLGPYSYGLAYYGSYFDDKLPIEDNWINRVNSDDFRGLVQYQGTYRPKAHRFSVGEQSAFSLLPVLAESLQLLNEWHPERIQAYCDQLSAQPRNQLLEMGFDLALKEDTGAHLWGIPLPDYIELETLKQLLAAHHVHVSFRGRSIRISPHLYNDASDMQALVACLAAVRASRPVHA